MCFQLRKTPLNQNKKIKGQEKYKNAFKRKLHKICMPLVMLQINYGNETKSDRVKAYFRCWQNYRWDIATTGIVSKLYNR